jgi:hypothetical protein
VWNNKSVAEMLAAFGTMVDWMRESKRGVKVLVSFLLLSLGLDVGED